MGCYAVLGAFRVPPSGWTPTDLGAGTGQGTLPFASECWIWLNLMSNVRNSLCALENTPEACDNRGTGSGPDLGPPRIWSFPARVLGGHLAPSGLTFLLCKMGALRTHTALLPAQSFAPSETLIHVSAFTFHGFF